MPHVVATLVMPDDWELAETSFKLDPQERRDVAVTAVGPGDGKILLRVETVESPAPGLSKGSLVIGVDAVSQRPTDWLSIGLRGLAAAGGILGLVVAARRLRPWEIRITRSP